MRSRKTLTVLEIPYFDEPNFLGWWRVSTSTISGTDPASHGGDKAVHLAV